MPPTTYLQQAKWVLLPGTLCTPAVFDPVLTSLGVPLENRHAIKMDAACVSDYAPRLRGIVTGGEIVCGFSLGAIVAAHNLADLTHAGAVVLLACNPLPDPPGNRANREAVRDRVQRGEARDWVTENWTAMSTAQDPEIRETVIDMAHSTTDLITAQTELAATRPGAADALVSSALPLVFVTGADDRLTPAAQIRPIAEKARSAHLSILPGLGHFALLEAPDLVAGAVRQDIIATAGART